MKKLVLGATGAIGSALAKKIVSDGEEVHLVARDEASLSTFASELNSTFTTCDVLEDGFSEKILSDFAILDDKYFWQNNLTNKNLLEINKFYRITKLLLRFEIVTYLKKILAITLQKVTIFSYCLTLFVISDFFNDVNPANPYFSTANEPITFP